MQFNTRLFLAAALSLATVNQACVEINLLALIADNSIQSANLSDNGEKTCWNSGTPLMDCAPNSCAYIDVHNEVVYYKNDLLNNKFKLQFKYFYNNSYYYTGSGLC